MADKTKKSGAQGKLVREEAKLRGSALDYRIIFDATSNGMAFTEADAGKIVDANAAWLAMTGFSREEAIGKTALELGLWPDPAIRTACRAALKEKGILTDYETSLVLKSVATPHLVSARFVSMDGRKYVLWEFRNIARQKQSEEEVKALLSKSEQSRRALLNILQDVKRAEAALRESEERFRSLFESSIDGLLLTVPNGQILAANPAACRMLGRSEVEICQEGRGKIVDQADPRLAALLEQRARTDRAQGELTMIRRDGSRFEVEVSSAVFSTPAGPRTGMVIRDITERKQNEAALRRINKAVECSSDAIGMSDPQGRHFYHNKAFTDLLEYTAKELDAAGGGPAVYVNQNIARQVFRTIMGGGSWSGEVEMVSKSGRKFPVLLRADAIKDESGKVIGLVGVHTDITERKRAEAEQSRLAAIVNSSDDAIIGKTLDGIITSWNRGAEKVFGYSAAEAVGKPITMLFLPERMKEEKEFLARIARGESLVHYETERVCKDGKLINVSVTISPINDADGKLVGISKIARDITERKRAEEALTVSEVRYRRLFEAARDGILILDAETGVIMDVNPFLVEMLEYPREQFLEKKVWQLGLFKDIVANQATFAELQRKEYIRYENLPLETAAGQRFEVEFVSNVYRVNHRKVIQCNIRDITERKRAEKALRASEAELHVILESTDNGILAVNREGNKVIKANRRFVEMWRVPQSLIDAGDNRALRNFVMKQLSDPDAFLKKLQSLDGTDEVAVDTLAFKDGRIFERHGFPMLMDGVVTGRVWSFRDVTERKRQERELLEKSAELERFTYTVSHDLKSPLVTVKTFLGYLEQDLLSPDKKRVEEDVNYIRIAAEKMGQLLDELLNLARVGRKTNPPVRTTFQEVAQEAVGLVAGRINTSGAKVQVADASVVLEGDRPRLVEIWQNLVENACKFMADQPKPRVEIGVEQRGGETVFFVRDNGAGIDPRHQEKVFGLFEKLNPKVEGTGMGLALVKRVVELYKGRIWVESEGFGRGANFLFTLPAAVIMETGKSS